MAVMIKEGLICFEGSILHAHLESRAGEYSREYSQRTGRSLRVRWPASCRSILGMWAATLPLRFWWSFGPPPCWKPRIWPWWLDRTTTVFVYYYLFEDVVLECLVRIIGVVTTAGVLLRVSDCFDGGSSFFFVFFFWLCASLISRFSQDIKLLQRLGVIGIILVLIYSLKKNIAG
jgi:hypothetical protein